MHTHSAAQPGHIVAFGDLREDYQSQSVSTCWLMEAIEKVLVFGGPVGGLPTKQVRKLCQFETPFTKYLECTLILLIKRNYLSANDLVAVLETLRTYILHKANLDEIITIFFELKRCVQLGHKESIWVLEPFQLVQLHWVNVSLVFDDKKDSILLASFLAHTIVDTLINIVRQEYGPLTDETQFRETLSFLEAQCTNWRSSKCSRLLGKVCRSASLSQEATWFETTGEQHERIANELLHSLRKSYLFFNIYGPRIEEPNYSEHLESFLSVCAQAPWVPKVSGRYAIWERLEKLGIFTRIEDRELRSPEDWAKKHQSQYFTGNN
jgi:hypothetical protein